MLGIFLDSETNGLNPLKHQILELAFKILDVDTGAEMGSYHSVIRITEDEWNLSDPNSLKINGFNWEKVLTGKPKEEVSNDVLEIFKHQGVKRGEAVYICQNPSFDRIFFSYIVDPDIQERLRWPYHWLDLASMYWAESIHNNREKPIPFPWETGFTKDKIANLYNIGSEPAPHEAMNGVTHLIECYGAVVGFPHKKN